jgi:hypothetical protein
MNLPYPCPGVRKLRIAGVNHGHLDWEMLLKEERHGCWGFLCTTKISCIRGAAASIGMVLRKKVRVHTFGRAFLTRGEK